MTSSVRVSSRVGDGGTEGPMESCPDCGCRTNGGVCSNCQEELYILTFQADDVESVSDEFAEKAREQAEVLERRAVCRA